MGKKEYNFFLCISRGIGEKIAKVPNLIFEGLIIWDFGNSGNVGPPKSHSVPSQFFQ